MFAQALQQKGHALEALAIAQHINDSPAAHSGSAVTSTQQEAVARDVDCSSACETPPTSLQCAAK